MGRRDVLMVIVEERDENDRLRVVAEDARGKALASGAAWRFMDVVDAAAKRLAERDEEEL